MRHLWIAIAFASCSSPSTTPRPSAGGSPFESFATTAPRVGDRAPDFQLADSDGKPVRLAEAIARGPVVLVWGSFS